MATTSDFDFDELDKAVTGAIGSDTETDETSDVSFSSATIEDAPRTSEPAMVSSLPAPSEPPKVAPAARRSSGRFMDVVHPSSDMRSRTSPAVFEPTKPLVQSFTPPVAKIEEQPQAQVSDVEDDADIDALSDSLNAAVGEWSKPLESPFLADAKVEKRPLGGVGPEPTFSLLEAPEDELKLEAPEEELLLEATLPDPIDFAAHAAAAELASEKEDTGSMAIFEEVPEEHSFEKPVEREEKKTTPELAAPAVIKEEAPVGPTSITQQYIEQANTTQVSGAIYDTENYHKPLSPVAKKKSGAWTILWILLLVILGAGAGVAFYLFVLPML